MYAQMSTWPEASSDRTLWVAVLTSVFCSFAAVQDWGFFLLSFWPFVIPWYAWKTRGRGGWLLTLGLMALILSPFLAGLLGSWLVDGVSQ